MSKSDWLERTVAWLASMLPERQALRKQEWLAELDSLPGTGSRLGFLLNCAWAVWTLQFTSWWQHPLEPWRRLRAARQARKQARRTNVVFFQPKADGLGNFLPGPFHARSERIPPEEDLAPFKFDDRAEKKD